MPVKNKADIYKALGDTTRLRIVSLLLNGELCVCELESVLDLSQSNVSRHLNKLSNVEIVTSHRQSQWIYYKIDSVFFHNNADLVNHISKIRLNDSLLTRDYERLEIYRKSNLSCDDLKLQKNKLFNQ